MSSDKFRYETPMRKSNYREIPIYGLMKSYRDIKQPFNDQKLMLIHNDQKLMLIHNHDCEDVKCNICVKFKQNVKRYQCICVLNLSKINL